MNRKDPLEDFIRRHREDFDDLQAPARVWKKIQRKQTGVVHLWKYTAIAASLLLLVAIGYILGLHAPDRPDIAGWEEYQETEKYYQVKIDHQMEKIKTLPVSREVITDLQLLDEVYADMRAQLLNDPQADTQLLLSAMIRHQQQKLGVMERILQRVDKYKTNENRNHEM